MSTPKDEDLHAKLVIFGAGEMTQETRDALSDWLRDQAESLENDGHEYAPTFTARYFKPAPLPARTKDMLECQIVGCDKLQDVIAGGVLTGFCKQHRPRVL